MRSGLAADENKAWALLQYAPTYCMYIHPQANSISGHWHVPNLTEDLPQSRVSLSAPVGSLCGGHAVPKGQPFLRSLSLSRSNA